MMKKLSFSILLLLASQICLAKPVNQDPQSSWLLDWKYSRFFWSNFWEKYPLIGSDPNPDSEGLWDLNYAYHYWRKNPLVHKIANVPAPLKQLVDELETGALLFGSSKVDQQALEQLPPQAAGLYTSIREAMVIDDSGARIHRANYALESLRTYVADKGMQKCYRIFVIKADWANAFNTGCTIYITSYMMDLLNNDDLLAVVAHELAHGDLGHGVKNIGLFLLTSFGHVIKTLDESAEYLVTGKMKPRLNNIVKLGGLKGGLDAIVTDFGKLAPGVETKADVAGAYILKRMGLDGKRLMQQALLKIHEIDDISKVDITDQTVDAFRDYPSLYTRLQILERNVR